MVDPGTQRKISRRALYDMVWSRAMIHLAKEFGLSDVGFAKLCKRNKIPRPPRGYWALKEVGKAPPPTPLPSPAEDWDIDVVWHKVDAGGPNVKGTVKTDEPVGVEDTLRDPHPLVKESLTVLHDVIYFHESIMRASTYIVNRNVLLKILGQRLEIKVR